MRPGRLPAEISVMGLSELPGDASSIRGTEAEGETVTAEGDVIAGAGSGRICAAGSLEEPPEFGLLHFRRFF